MPKKHRRQAETMRLPGRLVITVGLTLILLLIGSSAGFAQEDPTIAGQVRTIEPDELGITNPAGLAFSPAANVFYVVRGSDAAWSPAPFSDIAVLSASPVINQVGTVRVPAAIPDPINMAFDGKANRLLVYQPATLELVDIAAGPDGQLDSTTLTRHRVPRLGLRSPQGMTVDPASGQIYFLDSIGPRIVRIEPDADGGFDSAVISQLDLVDINLTGLRGLVFNPANGHLYTLNPARQTLYELTQSGRIVTSHDISSLALGDAQGLVFAPSGDLTDDPSSTSLYITDSGPGAGLEHLAASGSGGQIVEFSFDQVDPAAITAPTVVASLVQTIDTSAFHPPSPDSADIAYVEPLGAFLMTDSEVDEMPGLFTGDNVFEMTRGGNLLRTGTSLPEVTEPSGLTYDLLNHRFFIGDDGRRRIWEIHPGPDGLFFTDDDLKSSFYTEPFGSTDPEGVAYDTSQEVLFIADGVNLEVYRVDPGNNQVFDGVAPDGDDQVTSWDMEIHGATDLEGISYDAESGELYLVGKPKNEMFHVTTTGTLLRKVDMSAANATRPAGVTLAPSTLDPRVMNFYVVDRGVDNNIDPLENDGKVYELYVPAPTADVSLVKTVEPAAAVPGETITFTLSFHNAGNSTARNVTITDQIPPEVTVQSVYSSGVTVVNSGQSPPYVWQVQDMTTVDAGVIVVSGEVSPALSCFDLFTNMATIATTSADARSSNDSSSVALAAGAGISVDPASDSKTANQGQNVIYTLRVTNEGSCADIFDVSVSGTDWSVPVQSPVAVAAGAHRDVQVTMQVPSNASCGPESAIITFTSRGASEISASSELVTIVNPVYSAMVAPPTDTRTGIPGDVVTYTLRLTNTGNCLETFDLSASEPNWMSSFPSTVGPLYRGLGLDVNVVATVPPDALATDQDVTTMTFASQGNGATLANSILTTSADVIAGVDVRPSVTNSSGDPGAFAAYTLWVTNTGSMRDTFTFSATGDQWPASAQPTSVTLDPNQTAPVQVTVAVPPGAQCGDSDSSVVTFTSQNNGTVSDSSLLTTSANAVAALVVAPSSTTGWANPGSAAAYSLQVINMGNCRDTYDFSALGDEWPASAQPSAVTLDPGASAPVDVSVTVPSSALCVDSDSATVTFTSREDVAVSNSSTVTTRANAVYGVTLSPSLATASGDPGADATHNLLVTNIGNCQDTFTFSASGDDWPASTQASTVTLDPAQSAPVPVTVAVPAGARCVDSDNAAVTFSSQNDGAAFDRSMLTTSANPVSALTAVPSTDTRSAAPGSDAVYSLSLTNDGNCVDTFTIDAVGDTWPASALPTRVELDPGRTTPVQVTVAVPPSAQCGTDVAIVTFASNDGTASTSSTLTTSAGPVRGVTVTPTSEALSGDPGAPVVYSLSVTNDGNCVDSFTFSASGNTWTTSAPSVGPVDPGASTSVDVTVTVDPDALCNEQDIATVTFTSAGDGVTADSNDLTTTANPVYGVTVTPPSAAHSVDPGTGVAYTLWVTNTGNCSDTFIRSISGDTWPPSAPPFVGPLAPDAGESVDVTVPVPVCTVGGVSDAATVTFESQHDGTAADSASLTTTANNAVPAASDDLYDATEDVPLVVTATGTPPGVLHNDDDANCTSLTVSQYTQPANGTIEVGGDGAFTYTPAPNYHGIDSFSYHASDGVHSGMATVTITVESAYDDPVVEAGPDLPEIGDPSIEEGDTVSFAGIVEDPQPQSLLAEGSIHWDFGDGNTETGTLTPNHTYLDNDEYTVTLTVIDTEGDVGQDWLTVTVLNVPPVVYVGPDRKAEPGQMLSFQGSYTDTVSDTLTLRWDLSDGSPPIHGTDTFSHAFAATGDYVVTLTVTDDDGGVGTDSAIVSIRHKVYLPLVFRSSRP